MTKACLVEYIAANDGVVIKAGYVGSYGNLVMIDHGGGVVTAYGHGSEIIVKNGQAVSRRRCNNVNRFNRIINRTTLTFRGKIKWNMCRSITVCNIK